MAEPAQSQPSYSRIEVAPLSGALGAAITGIDLSEPLDDATFAEVERAFHENLVVVFPGQEISPADHLAFTRRIGPVEPHPLGSRRGLEDHPEVMVLENKPGKIGPRNDFWHSDISFGEIPPAASILFAVEITIGRSDTMFCNMYAAYESLSEGLKRMLDGMSAMHTAELLVREVPNRLSVDVAPSAVRHPVVRTHPATGRKALYVNPHYTDRFEGWTAEESRPLLDYLAAHATRPENVFRHRWSVGDFLIWDNRCTMHYALRDYDDTMPRFLYRTTAAGDRPV
ncbi:MAG: TauD/TfdA family dioxygenase [Alphaproteobacteria bacterium]|nr:TauD/TfdA family dioxygenase [Alphaproteobacteria bacterium]